MYSALFINYINLWGGGKRMIITLECPQCHNKKEMDVPEIGDLITEADMELDENPNDIDVFERKKEYKDYQLQHPNSKIHLTTLEIQDFTCSECGYKGLVSDCDNWNEIC